MAMTVTGSSTIRFSGYRFAQATRTPLWETQALAGFTIMDRELTHIMGYICQETIKRLWNIANDHVRSCGQGSMYGLSLPVNGEHRSN
jgi:hypothetical protein